VSKERRASGRGASISGVIPGRTMEIPVSKKKHHRRKQNAGSLTLKVALGVRLPAAFCRVTIKAWPALFVIVVVLNGRPLHF
jgi:hypothetical protein